MISRIFKETAGFPLIIFLIFFALAVHVFAEGNADALKNYDAYIAEHGEGDTASVSGPAGEISISGGCFTSCSDPATIMAGQLEGRDNVLIWDSETGYVDYNVNIEHEGFYNIVIDFMPLKGSNDPILRGFMLDGAYPFKECESFALTRTYSMEYPFKFDEIGNNLIPSQEEVFVWKREALHNSLGFHSAPLKFYLSKGMHVLRLVGIKNPCAISSITLSFPDVIPAYADYISFYSGKGKYDGELIIKEAENIYQNSSTYISVSNFNEPCVTPEANGRVIYNAVGGESWREPGQWVSWEIDIPEDGMYKIAFKYLQVYKVGSNTYRRLEIDGKVPFKELENLSFPFSQRWANKTVADDKGNPYLLYLTKGRHVIRLSVTSEPFNEVVKKVNSVISDLKNLDEVIKKTTGLTGGLQAVGIGIDRYRDWNIADSVPEAANVLEECAAMLQEQARELQRISGSKKRIFDDTLTYVSNELVKFAKDPDRIMKKLDIFSQIRIDLANWVNRLDDQPLTIDRIYVANPKAVLPAANAGLLKSIAFFFKNLFMSFTKNYGVANMVKGETLDIWVQRSRDYVNLMQELANRDFTPKTGINVNINFIPDNSLLMLSNAAGNSPDAACGLSQTTPFEFALRNALVNLNEFDDYDMVKQRFAPGTLVPFHYDRGDYALPETAVINMMFCRTDILEKLGLKPPQTWEDVRQMIPILEQNNCSFYYPRASFLTFYFQNGQDIYTKDGLKLNIDSPEGFRIFKDWTELYTVFGMPKEITSFYQHFRMGDVPIGIVPIYEYISLAVAAPEIMGNWEIKPIPGTIDKYSRFVRWQGGGVQGAVIFKSSERQEDCWNFLKWWTSNETQALYATRLEAFYGKAFRWFTANMEAMKKIPWSKSELDVLEEQMKWFKEMPCIPGGYFTARELENAWNRVVIDKRNPREEYEIAMEIINKELLRKQEEFGLIDRKGEIVKTLDIIDIPFPE